MYRIAIVCLIGMLIVSFATASDAGVEYSADSYMENADGVMKGPIHVGSDKERREYIQDGQGMVMIIRHDKKVVWMLMPNDETYMETKIPEEGRKDDVSSYKIDQTTVGPETVNGVKTTKSKVIMTGPDDGKMGGFWWATQEGVVVKMDVLAVEKGKKERFTINLENLAIGKQKDALFEIPAGYTKMDMGGFGNMMLGSDDEEDDQEDDEDAQKDPKQSPAEGKKKGFGWKDAVDLLK